MKLNNSQIKALELIITKLNNINYILTGSTNLALQGVDIKANDIDIITNKSNANKIYNLLKMYNVIKPKQSGTDKFRSYYALYNIEGINLEVIGNSEVFDIKNKVWVKSDLKNKIYIEFKKYKIPVYTLKYELEFCIISGRLNKATKIQECINGLL